MRLCDVKLLIVSFIILSAHGHINDVEDEINEHSLELTETLNLVRQELVQKTCSRYSPKWTLENLPSDELKHILVNEEHKLLYCYVPKVACTNWKRILMILEGKWNNTDVLSIPASLAHSEGMFRNLSSVPKEQRDYMLENYHKLIFVRNPFERLLSAYRNKLEGKTDSAKYFQQRVGKSIVKAFRERPSNDSLELGHDVTFKEFALFLTNQSAELASLATNEHWQPVANLCHPCLIKYTIIGKYETLVDDSLLALHAVNASRVSFPRLIRTSGTADKLRRYFSALPLPLIKKLYKLYEYDYRIFNYDLKNVVGYDLG